MTTATTRTTGITAFLTTDGVDFITRTATTSVRDSVAYSDLANCDIAGRKAKVELGDNVIAFATEKLALLLKPYTSAKGETYYWSPLEPIDRKPSISLDEAKKLAAKKAPAKRRARKAA